MTSPDTALRVELVSPEQGVWSGEAEAVFATTLEGEIGVLRGHAPVFGVLAKGKVVRVKPAEGPEVVAAVHGGFLSVADDRVSVLAEQAELADAVDVDAARAELNSLGEDEASADAAHWAQARLRAAGQDM